jgi:hypothetical protein
MKNFKREWINGLRIICRVFLLFFFVGGIYRIGKAFAMLTAEFIESESVIAWMLGTYALLSVALFPLIVSFVSEAVSLKAESLDRPFSKLMKGKKREPVGAGHPNNPPVKL